MRLTGLLAVTLLLTLLAWPAVAGALTLKEKMAPHKALYDIEMVSKKSGSQVLNISGEMFYEWRPGCDAWTTDHRFNLFYEYTDSPPIRITSDFSTYETYDGKNFNFTSRRKRNGDLYQEIRGHAEKIPGKGGKAEYSIPPDLNFDLDAGTLFPMEHSLEVLRHALAGDKFYNATVFDGSDEEGPIQINAFIGKKIDATALVDDSESIDQSLLETPAWKVRMAFFPLHTDDAADAEYEMDVVFHDNGVISDMLVEYRDFSVTQKLKAIESLEKANCNPQRTNAP